ncbi:translational activator of GCN4 [Steccherinum ochraceum]|uniref:Translational activator of GCN4 n=1 Tax=Steccherinum ochraceum TaxID=92696 RepID=A0A4R0RI05_9APHY|nr:translational activator of GCN4 [Steccherinum ochraceum]
MGKPEIESWIASTSSALTDPDGAEKSAIPEWRRDDVLSDWPRAVEVAQKRLLTSSTKNRRQFLREELHFIAKHVDLNLPQAVDVFKLLTYTYPRYADAPSREAVELVLVEIVQRDGERKLGLVDPMFGWFANEAGKISSSRRSSADPFILLSWCCALYPVCLQTTPDFTASKSWTSLITTWAILLDSILDENTNSKRSVKKSSLVRTRAALRSHPEHLPFVMKTLLASAKTIPQALTIVPLLGTAIDVTLRLKHVKDEELKTIDPSMKSDILAFYASSVLMSKIPVAPHTCSALHDFIANFVFAEDLSTILPTVEKAILRSPELSLGTVSVFFSSFSQPLEGDLFRKLLTPTLNNSRSTNFITRTSATQLFRVLVAQSTNTADLEFTVNEVLALPTAGKTAGPDHRVALFTMLGFVVSSASISAKVIQSGIPLLSKETHEGAIKALATALGPHLLECLKNNVALAKDTVAFIVKEMTSTKSPIRRAFCVLVGTALWQLGDFSSESASSFAQAVLPSFEVNLKTISANPLGAPGGPLDGYIAVAILLGPYNENSKLSGLISQNTSIQSLLNTGAKASFLLWDKVYQKLSDAEEESWLLRSAERTFLYFKTQLSQNAQANAMLGQILLHLSVNGSTPNFRRGVVATAASLMSHVPELLTGAVLTALFVYLTREKTSIKLEANGDETVKIVNKEARLPALYLACGAFSEEYDMAKREALLAKFIVIGHHSSLSPGSRQTWIEICQAGGVDPNHLILEHLETIISSVLEATDVKSKSYHSSLAEAAYKAFTTIAFVAPEVTVSRIAEQATADLNAHEINQLSETDINIWRTPEGTAYVDVLAAKKQDVPEVIKGKGYKDAQWEAEVRKSLANKKKATSGPTLSKQDAALVEAQLKKESGIRASVDTLKARLMRGLQLVHCLVAARVEEVKLHMSSLVNLLIEGGFGRAVQLVGSASFDAFVALSDCCSDRLDIMRPWIGVAALRSKDVDGIPEEMQVEGINSLLLRVLHRLRSQSEQTPFDVATYSYTSPLLYQVLIKGGVGLTEDDDPLEQVTLALQIIKFHCSEFSHTAFPRKQTLELLLHVIRTQSKLAKEASSALIDIGQAIHTSTTADELNTLFRGTLSQEVYVRNSCLQALQPFDLTELDWSAELWIAHHDNDEQNARLAGHLWEDNGLDVPEGFLDVLLPYLEHENAYVRSSCASSIATALEHWTSQVPSSLSTIEALYREKAKVLAPEFDDYGMLIAQSVDRADPWPTRSAIAQTFELSAPSFTADTLEPFFTFLTEDEALGDRNPDVRRGMLQAGSTVIDLHGPSRLAELIAMFEEYLSRSAPANETTDYIKEAVVILFGRLARHLDPADPRIPQIVKRLIEALKTPAEQVQIAVSECLSPLAQIQRSQVAELIDQLFDELFNAPKYAARRGAAYGLGGIIRGAGIATMREYTVIDRLKTATEDKKRYEPRQGAMFAFETFSTILGRLFEPYIPRVLPLLLNSFGDATPDVREATQDAARVIMGNLSGYSIKTILPSLLSGLDEKQWRTKKGSIELLGMMAYCAPRQLSQSLPIVIPQLTGVLTDSHAQVRAAANKSLKQFGEVISNPEIQSLVPVFLKAMVDPARTPNALNALIKTSFVHYIDHSSLALVVPIIERGLRERSAEIKRKAAQIVGNLASLTESKDFVPYLKEILPLVHVVLVDPVPEARATAAKCLGSLVERLGEIHFPDLVPGLLRTLKSDTSGVDRQGAAQGLSEVLAGLGMERMEGLLPDIIANAQAPRSTVREGFMSLLVYLPATFGTRFQPHLPRIVSPILSGLSDSEDYVREAAMRAGRMIVTNYSTRAIDLLLPELERGMFDPGWRIRQSSITLVGELLFKISGISGKAEIEEGEEVADTSMAESSRKVLVEVLGAERRDRILSALYLARQDAVNVVRQSSVHIWKALVHNTPRTVREILPELMGQIITLLSGDEADQQETAARTTVELCRKSGEKVLVDIVSILRSKSQLTDPQIRAGVCLTLCEVMESTTDAAREGHEDAIISMVRVALVDDEPVVRSAAARAFDVLQETIGVKAIDQTIPTLLDALRQPGESSGTALQALKEVMSVRAATVFPVLIPTLTTSPMSVFNARALESLVTVAGSALSKRLTAILTALVRVLEDPRPEETEEVVEAVTDATKALLGSISDTEGLHALMLTLLGWAKHEHVKRRVSACQLFAMFCDEETELDTSLYRVDWIRQLVSLMDDGQVPVHTAALHALDVFVKAVPKDELEPLVVPLRRTIEGAGAPGRHVPGFSLPKGVGFAVPVVIAGLTTGSNEQREQAAYAIGDLVERTEEAAIKPFVVPFTGPLIRVATQATTYPPGVKVAILTALSTMLERIPTFVKPFFPQLQRTFVKSASDGSSLAVRTKAGQALGVLMRNQPRVDPVVTELIAGARGSSEDAIASSLVGALAQVVKSAEQHVGERAREACVELVADAFKETHDDYYVQSTAQLFTALSSHPELLQPIVTANFLPGTAPTSLSSHCTLAVLEDADYTLPAVFADIWDSLPQKVAENVGNEKPAVARPAREARELLKNFPVA